MESDTDNLTIIYRRPTLADGIHIHQLIKNSPPLDLNSSYLYFLQSSHFADTCVVAERDGEILGYVSGYMRPDAPTELFVWQLVVGENGRGQGVAKALVRQQITQAIELQRQRQSKLLTISCTISPSNLASQGVFKSLGKYFGLQLEVSKFLTEEHFVGSDHEAEDEYKLFAPAGEILNDFLHDKLMT